MEVHKAYSALWTDYDNSSLTEKMYVIPFESSSEDNYKAIVIEPLEFAIVDLFMGMEDEISDDYGNYTQITEVPKKEVVKFLFTKLSIRKRP